MKIPAIKTLLVSLLALAWLAAAVMPESAEAARVGAGRSIGAQRQITPPPQRAVNPTTSPAAASNAAPAATPAQPAGGNRWLGPLAGLAAGLGLGWLFAQGGFGGLGSGLLIAMIAGLAVFALMRVFARSRLQAQGGMASAAVPAPAAQPGAFGSQWAGAGSASVASVAPDIPAGFNVEAFLKQAKLNFLRLQDANDRGDTAALREVATEEMAETLVADVQNRAGRSQHTEVSGLEATLLEVTTEGDAHWASVSFQGAVHDETAPAPAPFHEVWHLRKPTSGGSGWLLAGIQQAS